MLPSPILPLQNIQAPLIQPFFGLSHQSCANGIFTNIIPFLRVIFAAPQTCVPEIPLPFARVWKIQTVECPFPICDPALQRDRQISRCAKQVDVIWHQQIIAHQPGGCRDPCLSQEMMRVWIGQPWNPVFSRDCQQNKIRTAKLSVNSRCRVFSANCKIFVVWIHAL